MKSKIFILFITSILLGSCSFSKTTSSSIISSEENNNSSLSSVINPFEEHKEEIFEGNFSKEDITVQYLYDKYCVFFKDLVFATDNMNHVFKIKEDKIIEHYKFPLVELNPENYNKVEGLDIVEAVKIIGCPTYVSSERSLGLKYSDYDGYERVLYLEAKDDSYIVKEVYKNHKDNRGFKLDISRTIYPSLDDVKNLKVGMCIDDVYRILRGPLNVNKSSTDNPQLVDLDNGMHLLIYIDLADGINCEHFHHGYGYLNNSQYVYLYNAVVYDKDHEEVIYEIDNKKSEESINDLNDDNIFMNNSKISIDYLKENKCIFYENMVFASDKKNHVFFIENNKIKKHKIYDKINYPKDASNLFDSVKGMKFIETFSMIGIPSFMSEFSDNSLSYSCPYNKFYRLVLEKKNDEFIVKDVVYDYPNSKVRSDEFPRNWRNPNSERIIKLEDLKYLKEGMCVDDVVRVLGKPIESNYIDPLTYEFVYNGEDNRKIYIDIESRLIEKECDHAKINYDFSYDLRNKNTYGRTIYYYYFKDYKIVEG